MNTSTSNIRSAVIVLLLALAVHTCFCDDVLIPKSRRNYPLRGAPNSYGSRQSARYRRDVSPKQWNKCNDDYSQCGGGGFPWMNGDPSNCENCLPSLTYADPCTPNSGRELCLPPFVCNSKGFCDCPEGYFMSTFHCQKNCPLNHVAVNETCYKEKYLDEDCEVEGQCVDIYAKCTNGKCQCARGVKRINGECSTEPQCPIGSPARDTVGKTIECDLLTASNICPDQHACYAADYSTTKGICCYFEEMNCPVGEPLEGRNCSNCNWETHYCLANSFGVIVKELCCPTPCPQSAPILVNNICYTNVAFGAPCLHDQQCNRTVFNSECRTDSDGVKKCLCRQGRYSYVYNQCIREVNLNKPCKFMEDCRIGSNTICSNGKCQCYAGYFPEPQPDGKQATRCIGEPTCPTKYGAKKMLTYADCSFNSSKCSAKEYCRTWWSEVNRNFSLCCKKPDKEDFETLCSRIGMELQYNDPEGTEPLKCKINEFPPFINQVTKSDNLPGPCPAGTHCISNPYADHRNIGVCCKWKGWQRTNKTLPL
uniref:EGF-like domain-containing protein n=1 Tax=Trichuris muris TaxID=70415 RepID=A0A5S6R0N0_TRIMR